MFEVFGEFDSAEEINRAVAAQLAEGDMEAVRKICEENGIDFENVEYFEEDGYICTDLDAAWGKIYIEEQELALTKQELMSDWVDAIKNMCVDLNEMAVAVRKRGKRLEDCMAKILKYSFDNQTPVPEKLVEKALPNFKQRVTLGVPCMRTVKKLIKEYYLGE